MGIIIHHVMPLKVIEQDTPNPFLVLLSSHPCILYNASKLHSLILFSLDNSGIASYPSNLWSLPNLITDP